MVPIVMPPMPILRKSIAGAAPSGEFWQNLSCSLPSDAPCVGTYLVIAAVILLLLGLLDHFSFSIATVTKLG